MFEVNRVAGFKAFLDYLNLASCNDFLEEDFSEGFDSYGTYVTDSFINGRFLGWVAYNNDQPVGYLVAEKPLLKKELRTFDVFVKEEFRGGFVTPLMIKEMIDFGLTTSLNKLSFSTKALPKRHLEKLSPVPLHDEYESFFVTREDWDAMMREEE
jgi:hypothetical protein